MNEFLKRFQIHSSYSDFFTAEKIAWIEQFIEKHQVEMTPEIPLLFRALSEDLGRVKVIILGQDPYPQEGVATGLAFQVRETSWESPRVNASLKNILKLLYYHETKKHAPMQAIREAIQTGEFVVSGPYELLEAWHKQGVLLLNVALTTKVGVAGAHLKEWEPFIRELLVYITQKQPAVMIFLWGSYVKRFRSSLRGAEWIYSNHPAICGNRANPNDFLNSDCFQKCRTILWRQ